MSYKACCTDVATRLNVLRAPTQGGRPRAAPLCDNAEGVCFRLDIIL